MTTPDALEAIVSRCSITKNRQSEETPEMFSETRVCVDVSEYEYQAVSIRDYLVFKHAEFGNLIGMVAQKSDERKWKGLRDGYAKAFRVEISFLPVID